MPLSSLNKQCENLRPTTTIPSNFVNNLHNETITIGSAAQGGLRMGNAPPSPTITYLLEKNIKYFFPFLFFFYVGVNV